LSRPWAADAFLSAIIQQFVEKPQSITKLIMYSHSIKDMYSANRLHCAEDVDIGKSIRDFAYAPQRISSETKVLIRLALTFDASMTTAAQVITMRGAKSVEGQSCVETLEFLDDEVVLQLGMLADAAHEVDRLVRKFDQSDLDEAELPGMIDDCTAILRRLFVDGMCIEVPGLTYMMLKALRRPRTYLLRGVPKTIGSDGGVDAATMQRCLKRMCTWTVLAEKVFEGEFSDWNLIGAFRVFALNKVSDTHTQFTIHINKQAKSKQTNIHPSIYPSIGPYTNTYIRICIHSFIHSFVY
jgi:hypothetical protein